jgi:hypothetical protein
MAQMLANRAAQRLSLFIVAWLVSCGANPAASGVFFPTHSSRDAPSSQAFGSLEVEDGCLFLKSDAGALLPLWPSGFSFDGDAVHGGGVVVPLREQIELGGGGVSRSLALDLIVGEVPAACGIAPPFMVSDVIARP